MITLTDYWMDGRDSKYRLECTGHIRDAAAETVDRVNMLLKLAEQDGIIRDKVSSGWRPPSVNAATPNSAKASKHMTGEACDIADPDRALAQWCVDHPELLATCELWCEDFRWTPTWCHFQVVPPKSGKRIFIPSTAPPLAPALERQKPIPGRIVL